eukprot:Skav230570  [mRNA]  locus=scaffold971:42128:49172:- [translate_table: standard]
MLLTMMQMVERAHEELANDNQSLKRECESLRALFVRQQQQHIAFWSGPFLEMLGDKQQARAMAELAVSNAQEAIAAVRGPRGDVVGADMDLDATSRLVEVATAGSPSPSPRQGRRSEDSLERLRSELDYWRHWAQRKQRASADEISANYRSWPTLAMLRSDGPQFAEALWAEPSLVP